MADRQNEVRTPRARIIVKGTTAGSSRMISIDPLAVLNSFDSFPAKEYAITDDVLNISDSASVSIANDDGAMTGKFTLGQKIEIHEQDPDVSQGQWRRMFTGRLTSIESYSDIIGGSCILLGAMDLGWHLTSCHGRPLTQLLGITFGKLLDALIDPSWGFAPTETKNGNKLNRTLKQGRVGITRAFNPQPGQILPYIQIEPGQTPFDVLRTYAQREGVLINVGAEGQLILFRPDYDQQVSYVAEYHKMSEAPSNERNNLIGRPSLRETIDGLYSEVQCWSSVVLPLSATGPITDDPNASYRHETHRPSPNPLPFERRHVFSDGEALNPTMRKNRAIWKARMDYFNSWEYSIEFPAHSQSGAAFVSDSMIGISDTVHGIFGPHYVQSVRRSVTLREGVRAKLTVRKPRLLDPALTIAPGGTAKSSAALRIAGIAIKADGT